MFKNRYRLFEIFGIPVYLDISTVFLLLMFTSGGDGLVSGILCAVMLLASITAHELGHALTARGFGYETRDITLSLLGGCASIISLPRKSHQEFLVAAAGPAVSFGLAFAGAAAIGLVAVSGSIWDVLCYVVSDVLSSFGIQIDLGGDFAVARTMMWFVKLAAYFAVMNGMLGLFNLLPGFPMDGGRIFRSFARFFTTRANATYIAMIVGRVTAVFIGCAGVWRIVNRHSWGFVSILIAWMIWREGYREYQLARQEEDFRNWTQDDFNARVSPPPYDL